MEVHTDVCYIVTIVYIHMSYNFDVRQLTSFAVWSLVMFVVFLFSLKIWATIHVLLPRWNTYWSQRTFDSSLKTFFKRLLFFWQRFPIDIVGNWCERFSCVIENPIFVDFVEVFQIQTSGILLREVFVSILIIMTCRDSIRI